MRTRALALTAGLVSSALFATSCGGDDGTESVASSTSNPPATAPPTTEGPTTAAPTTSSPEPTAETTTTTSSAEPTGDTTTTAATSGTAPPASSVPAVAVGEIPALVVEWGSGAGDPLDLARRLVGFPLDIAPPAGSTPFNVSVAQRADGAGDTWRWDWSYGALAAPGTVDDIDADLPEGGPGTIEGRLHYDPQFAALGWTNQGQVISDPSNGGGGPQSVNWSYRAELDVLRFGDRDTAPISARAWVDRDIDFRAGDDRPGHRIDVSLSAPAGDIVVPLLEALLDELPSVPGGRLDRLDLASFDRPADSSLADEGTRYLELAAIYTLDAGSTDAAREASSTGLVGTIFQAGEEDFFEPGFIEAIEPTIDDDGRWTQPIIVFDRYPGTISVWNADDGSLFRQIGIRFEPGREILQELPD